MRHVLWDLERKSRCRARVVRHEHTYLQRQRWNVDEWDGENLERHA